jgi:serine protease Do
MRRALPYILVFFLGFIVCAFVIQKLNLVPGIAGIQTASGPAPGGVQFIKPGRNQVRDAAKLVSDYVVNIDTVGRPMREGGFFPFMEPQEVVPKGQASGVVFAANGYVITNNHVVENAAKLTVTTRDGKKFSATLVGRDPKTDIAVIKIDAGGLRFARFADYSVQPGDWVIAVGSPLGLESTVTIGVVSAVKRGPIRIGNDVLTEVIQTDAAINPGNSGGALADLNGNLVGVNTAIASPSGGSIGIGFAIPASAAKRVAEELIKHGKVVHPYIGITYHPYNADVRKQLETRGETGLPNVEGARIMEVIPDGPAANAGIQPFDIVVKINGKQISGTGAAEGRKTTLADEIGKAKVGNRMLLEVWHASSGRITTVGVVVGEMPQDLGR